jgi:acetylornithine deacetylase/succinyl-diaminopimelate desuccinylase-like protein
MREAYGQQPIEAGMGGSIPFVAALSAIYPEAAFLLIGVADPTSQYHAPNESVELADIISATAAQSIAISRLGE